MSEVKKYTKDEFISEFGDANIILSSYYKYCFGYNGESGNKKIYINVGGSSDDIYRFEPVINEPHTINSLVDSIEINYASIYDDDKKLIGEYMSDSY